MLIKVNDGLVINSDRIAAACWVAEQSRWRLALAGHAVVVYLTQSELDHIMNEVSTRQMIALMRMSSPRPPRRSRPEQRNGDSR